MGLDQFTIKQLLMEGAQLGAMEAIAMMSPASDDIRFKDAIGMAGGARWLRDNIDAGNLTTHRRGTAKNSPIYLSRKAIVALKMSERMSARLNDK